MRYLTAVFVLLCLLAGAGPCQLLAAPASSGTAAESTLKEVREAISTAWSEHIAAATRKDLKGVIEIYADDVVYIAYEIGTVIGPIRQNEEINTVRFHFMAMWRQQTDGTWRIGHMVGQPE